VCELAVNQPLNPAPQSLPNRNRSVPEFTLPTRLQQLSRGDLHSSSQTVNIQRAHTHKDKELGYTHLLHYPHDYSTSCTAITQYTTPSESELFLYASHHTILAMAISCQVQTALHHSTTAECASTKSGDRTLLSPASFSSSRGVPQTVHVYGRVEKRKSEAQGAPSLGSRS